MPIPFRVKLVSQSQAYAAANQTLILGVPVHLSLEVDRVAVGVEAEGIGEAFHQAVIERAGPSTSLRTGYKHVHVALLQDDVDAFAFGGLAADLDEVIAIVAGEREGGDAAGGGREPRLDSHWRVRAQICSASSRVRAVGMWNFMVGLRKEKLGSRGDLRCLRLAGMT